MSSAAIDPPRTHEAHTIMGREVRLPVDVRDATAAVAFYLVSARAAQKLSAASGLRIAQPLPGRTVCTIGTVDYKDGDLGRYHEVAVTFFVHDPDTRPLPFASALFGMARGSLGAYVHLLPVDGEFTLEAGRGIWGFPKFMAQIDISPEDGRERSTLTVGGERVLTQTVRTGGSRSFANRRQVSYAVLDGVRYRTPSEMSAEGLGVRMGGATLELGTHRLADELRSLGLPKRPLFTTYMGKMTARFYDAERTPASS